MPRETATPVELVEQTVAGFLLGYGPNTRCAYQSDLECFFVFCEGVQTPPQDATRGTLNAFSAWMREVRGYSASTVARRLTAVSSWFRYLLIEGYVDRNPMEHVRRPKVGDDSASTGLTKDELNDLQIYAYIESAQTCALIMLLSNNGLRISEALNLDVEDLRVERGYNIVEITRKGGKTALVPLNNVTYAAIMDHLNGRTTGPIFLAPHGGRLDRFRAYKLIRKLAKKAGLDESLHPHDLRATFVTMALEAGAPLQDVQDAVGHADPRTTQRYNSRRNRLENNPTFLLGGGQ